MKPTGRYHDSVYRRIDRRPKLVKVTEKDKRLIAKAYLKNLSSQKILERYDEKFDYEYTLMQIAAIKAHITMGTY